MAALPIGGYHPKDKFGYGNVTPEEAVQIHQDVLAMCSLAVGWGTFTLSNEYYLEPPRRLNEELSKQKLSEMQFFLLKHGESRLIEIKEADKEDDEPPQENGVPPVVPPVDDTIEGEVCGEEKKDDDDSDVLQQLVDNFTMDEEKKSEEEEEKSEEKEEEKEE